MPIVAGSAYATAEDILTLARAILNDAEVPGGDVLTDTAPFSFPFLNAAFRRVQIELAAVGGETFTSVAWLIALPQMPTIDPEGRIVVNNAGTQILYPNGVGNLTYTTPQLPIDLVLPLRLWERQTNTTNFTGPAMAQPNGGLLNMTQQSFLVDWEWKSDGIWFRGAVQVQDVKVLYEKQLKQLAATTDPVPIRGVNNAAAFFLAEAFAASRGGMNAPSYKEAATEEISLLKAISARRRQRKQVRRQPYSGRGGRQSAPYL